MAPHKSCCILSNVKHFRPSSTFTAFLALATWVNVQVMVCCWSFSAPAKSVTKIKAVSGEHACCHRHTEPVFIPVNGAAARISAAHAVTCGGQHGDPALQSTGPSSDLALTAEITFFHASIPAPVYPLSETPVCNTGPPVFLALRRLLI
jgi:hypothetical protein